MPAPEPIDPRQIQSAPIRHAALPAKLLAQIQSIFEVLGPYLGKTLEQFEVDFMRDTHPAEEVAVWLGIMLVWMDYHEKHLDGELMSGVDERKLLSALIVISSGGDDPAQLGVPPRIGQRLLDCYEALEEELDHAADEDDGEAGAG